MSAASPSSHLAGYAGPAAPVQTVIDLHAPQELSAWMAFLGCSEERLRLAIAAVGPEVAEVCNHLGSLLPPWLHACQTRAERSASRT